MQLQGPILDEICNAVRSGVNFLIFGAGCDTEFWVRRNSNGRTVVLEDNPVWAALCRKHTQCVQVRYTTRQADALELLSQEGKLREMYDALPPWVCSMAWDVILVDGPGGGPQDKRNPAFPGRMQPIYAASRLRGPGTVVFVDDLHAEVGVGGGRTARVVEMYARRFLQPPGEGWTLREIRYLHEGWLPNAAARVELPAGAAGGARAADRAPPALAPGRDAPAGAPAGALADGAARALAAPPADAAAPSGDARRRRDGRG